MNYIHKKAMNYIHKKTPSWMFDRVLDSLSVKKTGVNFSWGKN